MYVYNELRYTLHWVYITFGPCFASGEREIKSPCDKRLYKNCGESGVRYARYLSGSFETLVTKLGLAYSILLEII